MRSATSIFVRVAAVLAIAAFALTGGNLRASVGQMGSGIDLANLDRTCKPCSDFYQFANGGWIKNHPIPSAYPAWGTFNVVAERNRDVLHQLLDSAASAHAAAGSNRQKLGDFYASCMNETAIERAGVQPLASEFGFIGSISDGKSLATALAALHLAGSGGFFNFGSGADFKSSTHNIAQLDQGGLGLPDRDYYTKDDAKSKQIRDAYLAHVTAMFALAGDSPQAAAGDAQTVMTIETALATNSLTRVQRRDPNAIYHKMSLPQLQSLAPNFDWQTYFRASGVAPADINVAEPDFFSALSSMLPTLSFENVRTYLRWQLLHAYAPTLPKSYVDANFAFYSKQLQGTLVPLPRWKRCVRATDGALGEALGQLYVAKVFPPKAKAEALAMVKNIKATLRSDIATLSWMSAPTRQKALEKLDAFILKIGYPDHWRDYSGLKIGRVPYATNVLASNEFDTRRDYGKIGKTVDRSEWGLTPPTVNAYYNPTVNEIVFPAGILQPPFFNPQVDPAVNYGAIGAVIGHESTHGFDDQGRQFDKDGNLTDWWTADDAAQFNARAGCIVDQFNALEVLPGVHENGKQIEGEAIADLGGLTIAYKAFEKWQAMHPRRTINGFSPEQRFFIGFATFWASSERPEYTRLLANVDVHPYDKFRVNATVSNMPQFAAAWFCKLNDTMVRPPASRCQIW